MMKVENSELTYYHHTSPVEKFLIENTMNFGGGQFHFRFKMTNKESR